MKGATKNNCIGSEDGWTDATTKELLNKMKQAIPNPDVSKYKTMLEKFEWDKVKMGRFSAEDCKKQWFRVYKKLRKFKTLSDLIVDSLDYIENPYKGNVKKHPDHPKRPLTPYFRFFLGEREKYAANHKDLTNLEITSILSKKYREITIEEKERFMNDWKAEMVEYRKNLEKFKQNHPEYYDKSPPRTSRTPLQIFNQENMTAVPATKSKAWKSKKHVQETLKNKYHDLEDDQKLPYILKSIEEWEKYKEELEMYKKSHPNFVPTPMHTKSVLTISDWRIHDKSLGKPDRPPANGYNLFCTRMMVSDAMKHLSSRDRIMECGQKWKLLTDAEKQTYQTEFLSLRENYRYALKNFLKSLTPRQREEYLERKKETETKKNQKRKVPIQIKEEVISEEDSTSEEESTSDSTSSDSSDDEENEEEEADEEAEEDTSQPASSSDAKVTSSAPLRPTTPISALFLYQKAHREKFTEKHPKASKSDITIMLARQFNNLPQQKKAKYMRKEKEQRALYNEQMRKHLLNEQAKASKESTPELKPVTGEQIYQEQTKENFLVKAGGSAEKAQELMRSSWTHMNKERRKKYINIAHQQNAKNIAEHQATVAATKGGKNKSKDSPAPVEENISQKEIKSYLALEPKKVPKDGLLLFRQEHKPKLHHLMPNARNQELLRIWSEMSTKDKGKYKERAKAGLVEYNKKLQRWIKSLPPQAHDAYQAQLAKKTKAPVTQKNEKTAVSNGKRKKAAVKTGPTSKKAKIAPAEESDESSDDSSDEENGDSSSSSSDDSDGDSDSSSSDDSSGDSDSSSNGGATKYKITGQPQSGSSDDSSSSSGEDESDSD
uniref:nucleolar transcription factor 1-like n=1 Tax=Styela clava TaxID=7725 RepID=UPI00193A6627|nr:nucleolar transcription factor 1-like [Styela clava]